jgi:hypothetical protein
MKSVMTQRGHILVLFLFCLMVLALPTHSLVQRAARHDRVVLQTAKTAVMTWAVARYPGREKDIHSQAGEMVVPDKDVPGTKRAGVQDSNVAIGRLPWKTLGLPPVFDAHGEPLWYTVSSQFRDNVSHKQILDCKGLNQLKLYAPQYRGPIATKGIAAVVIAGHRALGQQQRGTEIQKKRWYNYIESAHPTARPTSLNKEMYRHLMQGPVLKNSQLVMNDQLLPIECQLIEKALKRRNKTCQ